MNETGTKVFISKDHNLVMIFHISVYIQSV